jgi:uncharacterized Ntn-hydrolase superfamily protein
MRPLTLLLGLTLLGVPRVASATWSVVMVDRERGAAGVAVASCVPLDVLEGVPVVVPGVGAGVTQSYLFEPAHGLAEAMLASGEAPEAIVAALTAPAFDDEASLRQYAVLTLDGALAQHTGAGALPFAGHAARTGPRFVTLAQGNVLTSPAVLDGALGPAPPTCTLRQALAERLVAATAGATLEGDARCTPDGVSAESALVVVDEGDGALVARAFELGGESEPGGEPVADPVLALAAWAALGATCLERPRARAAKDEAPLATSDTSDPLGPTACSLGAPGSRGSRGSPGSPGSPGSHASHGSRGAWAALGLGLLGLGALAARRGGRERSRDAGARGAARGRYRRVRQSSARPQRCAAERRGRGRCT